MLSRYFIKVVKYVFGPYVYSVQCEVQTGRFCGKCSVFRFVGDNECTIRPRYVRFGVQDRSQVHSL